MDPEHALTVSDVAADERYEATIDGELAGSIEYVVKYGRLALIHTEVLPEYEGKGVGSALVRFAIADARRRGLRVIPTCPFVRSYVESHPETHDIVIGMTPQPAPAGEGSAS
jgi:predicted GNAT family acetyltransferase